MKVPGISQQKINYLSVVVDKRLVLRRRQVFLVRGIVAFAGIMNVFSAQTILAAAPGVTTQAASSTSPSGTVLSGTITSTGGGTDTSRGFVYGLTTAYTATSSDEVTIFAGDAKPGYVYSSTLKENDPIWTQSGALSLYWSGIAASADGTKLVAVDGGTGSATGSLYTSTDSGATWATSTGAGSRKWSSVTSSSDGVYLAAADGSSGYIYTSSDSGTTWATSTSAGARSWNKVAYSADGSHLYAAPASSYIYTSTDHGTTWSTQSNSSGSRNWTAVAASSDGMKVVALESFGYIYTSSNGGVTWTTHNGVSDPSHYWTSVASSADGATIIAGASPEYVYVSKDSGTTWTQVTSLGYHYWSAVAVSADGTKLVATRGISEDSYLYVSLDGGTTWVTRAGAGLHRWGALIVASQGVFGAGAFSRALTGLACNTMYHAAAYATNGSGTTYGSDVTFTTSSCPVTTYIPASCPASTDLATEMNAEVLDRITGFSTTTSGFKSFFTTLGNGSGGWVRNPGVWTNQGTTSIDFTGVSPWNSAGGNTRAGVMISPRHIAFATHFQIPIGSSIIFVDQNNNVITRTLENFSVVTGTDITIGVLDTDLPGNIPYAPILSSTQYTNYINNGTATPFAVWSDQTKIANIASTYLSSGFTGEVYSYPGPAASSIQYPYYKYPIGGDSGSAVLYIIGGKLVLGSTITSPATGPLYGYSVPGINSLMTSMGNGNGYQVTGVDLSCFTPYAPLAVAAQTFTVAENAGAGAAVGTVATVNGQSPFTFVIQSGNTNDAFSVNSTTGAITVNNPNALDRSTTPTFTLVVQVTDSWSPATVTTATVTVMLTPVSGYARTNYGTVSMDGTWTKHFVQGTKSWDAITSSSDGTKLAASIFYGYIYTSTDSGATWTEQSDSGQRLWHAIASSADGTKLAAVVASGYIYTSTDSGVTWTARVTDTVRGWNSIASSADGTKLVAVASNDDIYTSTDSGVTWTAQTGSGSRNWNVVTSSADGTKLAAAVYGGYIYTSTDSGVTWTAQTGAGSRYWNEIVSSSDGTKIVASRDTGTSLYISTDSGVTWTTHVVSSGLGGGLTSSADGTKLIAGVSGSSGYLYISTDSGTTWATSTAPGLLNWSSVTSSSDGTKFAATVSPGSIYTSSNSGTTWTAHTVPRALGGDGFASSADGTKLAASVFGDYIHTSTDSGATWTSQTGSGSRNWFSVTSSADGAKLMARLTNDYIYTSTDSGVTWTAQTGSGQRNWTSVAASSDGTKLAATVFGGYIYTSADSGVTWATSTASGSRSWQSIASSANGTKLAAAVSGGYIYTSADSGMTWTAQTASGSHSWASIASSADGTKLAAIIAVGYLYTSSDSGATWTARLTDASRNWVSSITSSSDGTKIAAASTAGLYLSGDGGATWTAQTVAGAVTNSWTYPVFSADATKLVASNNGYIYTYLSSTVAPPTLAVPTATSITPSGATLSTSIAAVGAGAATVRGFVYGAGTAYGATTTESGVFGISSFSSMISGLTSCATYHYAAYAQNSAGINYTADQAFTTTGCPGGGGMVVGSGPGAPSLEGIPGYIKPRAQVVYPDGHIVYLVASPVPVSVAPSLAVSFPRDLTLGAKGTDVLELQKFLNNHGYPVATEGAGSRGNETAYFGLATKQALAKYQAAHGITPAQGYFGMVSRGRISTSPSDISSNPTSPLASSFTKNLTLGAKGTDVLELQKFLNNHGYPVATEGAGSRGNETAYFGLATKQALARFQASLGIIPAEGYLGPISRAVILKER